MDRENIFLIGFMGAGKSTVAVALKERLGYKRVEMDQRIEETRGMTISDIFARYGEAYFRNLESNTLIELGNETGLVISCGGGVVLRPENAEYMKRGGRVVLLTARLETVYERVKDSDERPILNGHMNVEYIEQLMNKRASAYQEAADVVVVTDGKSVEQVVRDVYESIHRAGQPSV